MSYHRRRLRSHIALQLLVCKLCGTKVSVPAIRTKPEVYKLNKTGHLISIQREYIAFSV